MMPIVKIVWIDAGMKMGWQQVGDVAGWMTDDEHFLVTTVGFLFAESEHWLVVVSGKSDSKTVTNPTRINKNTIQEMTYVTDESDD
jgi:hypothetical protein